MTDPLASIAPALSPVPGPPIVVETAPGVAGTFPITEPQLPPAPDPPAPQSAPDQAPGPPVEPPVVVTVSDDASADTDVSVPVPGAEGGGAEPISDRPGTDITAPLELSEVPVEQHASSLETPEPAGASSDDSEPVLSLADTEDARDEAPLVGEAALDAVVTQGSPGADETAPDASNVSDSTASSDQYHDENSQYQTAEDSTEMPWNWLWYLDVNCDGEVTSTGVESGNPSSLEWTWDWEWDWECGAPANPPSLDALDNLSSEPEGATRAEAGEPWLWTWEFTFCGQTEAATLDLDSGTPLRWRWDWTWKWTCESEPASSAGSGAPTVPSELPVPSPEIAVPAVVPDPQSQLPSTETGALPLEPPLGMLELPAISTKLPAIALPPFVLPEIDVPSIGVSIVAVGVDPALAPELPSVLGLEVPPFSIEVPTTSVTVTLALVPPSEASLPPAEPPTPGPSRTAPASEPRSAALPRASSAPLPPEQSGREGARGVRAPKASSATHATDDASRQMPPRPVSAAGTAGASGGVAPSGLVGGVAALIGILVLTAPGLGRRIRAARELRPRGLHGSSIDRPG